MYPSESMVHVYLFLFQKPVIVLHLLVVYSLNCLHVELVQNLMKFSVNQVYWAYT